jgi:mannosyltransferase OCH1-like enzyme
MSNNLKNIINSLSNNNHNKYDIKSTFKNVHNKRYNNKILSACNFQIPANIFQTWHSKEIPLLMMKSIINIKKNNPNFHYYLFDDNDCANFIKKNFPEKVLNAYNSLIPGAYKADLWRYCILYKMGGIYMDIKYTPINGFKLYNLLEKEHWVLDIDNNGIYNAVMVCKPGNQILLKAIEKICVNVENKNYGNNMFEPTGPALLADLFSREEKNLFDMKHVLYGVNDYEKVVQFNGENVLNCYPGYFKERSYFMNKKHYADLWNERRVYL